MLSRRSRLNKRADILTTMRRGNVVTTKGVRIYVVKKSPQQSETRIACVVGRRVHKSAVVRHRYQRWLREEARVIAHSMAEAYDMVWVATPGMLRMQNIHELDASIRTAINKLGIKQEK